jgi:hypothetical protein
LWQIAVGQTVRARRANADLLPEENDVVSKPARTITRMTRRRPKRTASLAINIVVASISAAAAQTPDLQTKCAVQAEVAFEQLTREYTDGLESLRIPFDISRNDYRAHYSNKLSRCLFLIRKTVRVMRSASDISYLLDTENRNMYALYVDTDGKMESCALMQTIQNTKACKERKEFDTFVEEYMKD